MPEPQVRIFVSSPSDVEHERALVKDIIEQLAQEYLPYFKLQAVLWEEEALTAAQSFQAGLLRPAECEIVLVMLWTRLGTPLAEDPYGGMTGTEWEFVDAVEASAQHGTPEVLVYQKTAPRLIDINDAEAIRTAMADRERLESFFRHHFYNPDGSFRRAFRQFDSDAGFRGLVESQLRKLLNRRISAERRFAAGSEDWLGSPFRALAPYDIGDDRIFTGRETESRELVARLDRLSESGPGLLLLSGASGIGKSSLVRCGLLPHLVRPFLFTSIGACRWCLLEPSHDDPIAALAAKLATPSVLGGALGEQGLDGKRLARLLVTDGDVGVEQIGAALERTDRTDRDAETRAGRTQLIIILDPLDPYLQPERIDTPEIQAFAAILATLARHASIWVIATLRSHLLPSLAHLPALNALLDEPGWYRVEPPAPARIRQVMEIPGRVAGIQYEEPGRGASGGLVDALESEASDLKHWPTLLEPALEALYRLAVEREEPGTRHGRLLRFADYRQLGGIAGTLVNRADALWNGLDDRTRAALPMLCRALLSLEAGPRSHPTPRAADLATLERDPGCADLIGALTEARLIVLESVPDTTTRTQPPTPEQGVIAYLRHALNQTREEWRAKRRLRRSKGGLDTLIQDEALTPTQDESGLGWEDYRAVATLVHPALIERWQPVRDWLSQPNNRRDLNLRYQIGRQAALWKRTDFNREYLLGELGHAAARLFVESHAEELDPLERDYLDHSWAHLRTQRRRNRWTIGSITAALTLFAGIAFYGLWDANHQTKINQVRGSLLEADLAIRRGDTPTAVALALEAGPYLPKEATDTLGRALSSNRLLAMLTPDQTTAGPWITSVFGPDGNALITGSKGQGIRLWKRGARGFEQVAELAAPGNHIERVRFAGPEADPTIIGIGVGGVWRLPSASDRPPDWNCGTRADAPLTLDPEGRHLALISDYRSKNAQLCMLDLEHPGEPLWRNTESVGTIRDLAFAPDGQRLVAANLRGFAQVFDTKSGEERLRLPAKGSLGRPAIRATFDDEGARIAVAALDERIHLYDRQGREIQELGTVKRGKRIVRIHQSYVRDLAFTADGFGLIAGDSAGQLVHWDLRAGTAEVLGQQELGIDRIAVTREVDPTLGENLVLSLSLDGTARLWALETGRQLATLSQQTPIAQAAFSRDGQRIMTSSTKNGAARLWSVAANNRLAFHMDQEDHVRHLAMAESGADLLIATADYDGRVELWRHARGPESRPPTRQISQIAHQARVRQVAFSSSGRWLASAGSDGFGHLWDLTDGHDCALPTASKPQSCQTAGEPDCPDVYRVLFAPDASWLMTASSDPDRPVRLWDPANCTALSLPNALSHFEGRIRALTLREDGDANQALVATGSQEGVIQVLRQNASGDWSRRCRLEAHTASITELSFSPDGNWLASASRDGRAALIALTEAGCGEPSYLDAGAGSLYDVQFAPDSRRLVTAAFEAKAQLWSIDGDLIAELSGHQNAVSSARFSPDGRWILTASRDGTLRVWRTPTGSRRQTLTPFLTLDADLGAVTHAAFSPDGHEIAAGYWENAALLWRLWSEGERPANGLTRTWGRNRARLALIEEAIRYAEEHTP
ncbi:AAA family ATPase [Thiorhodococcus fuscus]|uniref:AAA family ATPase n=1 Tax=Thiorhodococcus fuscus TaxID=527200 RepID=A0ABW4Y9P9_9GAMM